MVELEELWGDYLVSRKSPDAAVNHFTEAGAYLKAIQAAIDCRQWAKAAQIVETLPVSISLSLSIYLYIYMHTRSP